MRKISKESQATHYGGDRFYKKSRKLIEKKTKTTTHRTYFRLGIICSQKC